MYISSGSTGGPRSPVFIFFLTFWTEPSILYNNKEENAEAIPEARILDMKEVSSILRKRELGQRCGFLCTNDLIPFLPINMSENHGINLLDWVLPTASFYVKK